MQKRYIVGIELVVLLVLFLLMSFFWSIQQAILVIVPLGICTFEGTILIWLSCIITKHFKRKFNEQKETFIEEFDKTKDYYRGR